MFRHTHLTPLLLLAVGLAGCQDASDPLAPAIDTEAPLAGINGVDVETRDVNIDLAFGTVTIPGAPAERFGHVSTWLTASLAEAVRDHGPFPGSAFNSIIDGFVGSLSNADLFAGDLEFLGDPVDFLAAIYTLILLQPEYDGEIEITSLGSQSYNLATCDDGSEIVVLVGSGGPGCTGAITQGTASVNFYRVDLDLRRVRHIDQRIAVLRSVIDKVTAFGEPATSRLVPLLDRAIHFLGRGKFTKAGRALKDFQQEVEKLENEGVLTPAEAQECIDIVHDDVFYPIWRQVDKRTKRRRRG